MSDTVTVTRIEQELTRLREVAQQLEFRAAELLSERAEVESNLLAINGAIQALETLLQPDTSVSDSSS